MADDPVWGSQSELTAAIALDDDDVLGRDVSDTTDDATGTVGRMKWRAALGLSGITPGGRLTLESGVPVSTTDQTAKGTLYYCPYVHDFVRLYNGTRPMLYTFTERSLSLTLTSGKNYDVFLYDNSGTLTLELSAAWTNDTTRADALAWQAGVGWVKSGTATRLHLGTIRASGTNTTEDSGGNASQAGGKRYVWNRYNQVSRWLSVFDSTDNWSYTTSTWRQMNNTAGNKVEFVVGDVEPVSATAISAVYVGSGGQGFVGLGVDSTSANSALACNNGYAAGTAVSVGMSAQYEGRLASGYHYLSPLEYSLGGTCLFLGDNASVGKSGLVARVNG